MKRLLEIEAIEDSIIIKYEIGRTFRTRFAAILTLNSSLLSDNLLDSSSLLLSLLSLLSSSSLLLSLLSSSSISSSFLLSSLLLKKLVEVFISDSQIFGRSRTSYTSDDSEVISLKNKISISKGQGNI